MKSPQFLLSRLSTVRSRGADRWSAKCPAHDDRSPSLAIRYVGGRTLLKCFAGCTAAEIVAALDLTLADLYDKSRHSKVNPAADRRRLAAQGLEKWRQAELQRCAENLRLRDILSREITRTMQAGAVTEAQAWDWLEEAYRGYSTIEDKFARLLRNQEVLELWRESRRGDA